MKIRDGYLLSEVAGTSVVVPLSADTTFRNMLKLNATGKLLWERLTEGADRESLILALLEEYEVTRTVAEEDTDRFLDSLRTLGVLEE